MKRLALAAALALSACAAPGTSFLHGFTPGTPVALSQHETDLVHDGIRAELKDPESARFGETLAARSPNGQVAVCGYVNAKNSFGGYTGEQLFVGMIENGTFALFDAGEDASDWDAQECRFAGVQI